MKISKLFKKNKTGKLPTFLIIGAQKAGTSALHNYLAEHPQLFLTEKKEIHFFDLFYIKGIDWYKSHFANATENQIQRGESTPYYLYHPRVPELVKKHIPAVKIIVILRNPVDRAYSHFKMMQQMGDEKETSFLRALELEEERLQNQEDTLLTNPESQSFNHQMFSYKARGMYAEQIKRWHSVFPKDQFLFLNNDWLANETENCLARVHNFLGVSVKSPEREYISNKGNYIPLTGKERKKVHQLFLKDQEELAALIGEEFRWN